MLRSKFRKSSRFLAFLHIYQLLQILTLIFRPEEHLGLAWNYSSLSMLWTGLSIIARLDYLAIYLGFAHVWIIFCVIICIYVITKALLLYKVEFQEFVAIFPNEGLGGKFLRKYILYLHILSNLALFSFLPMSTLQALMNIPSAIEGQADRLVVGLLYITALSLYLLIYLEDSLFLQKLSWINYERHEIVASNKHILFHRITFLAANLSVVYSNFEKNALVYSLILFIIGLYQAYLFAFKLPFGALYRNIFKGIEGVLLIWAGFVLFISDMNGYTDQESYFPTLIYFIPIVFIIYIYKEFISWRYNKLIRTKIFLNSTQVFHILLDEIDETKKTILNFSDQELNNLIRCGIVREPENLIYSLWLVYLMTLKEKFITVKLLISELTQKKKLLLNIYIAQSVQDFNIYIRSTPSEQKPFEYLLYITNFHELLKSDRKATYYTINLYNDLLAPQQDSMTLSIDMTHFYKSILDARQLYSYMARVFDRHPSIFEMHAGYLEAIENSTEAVEEYRRAHTYKQEMLRKQEANEIENIYFSPESLVLIISAEKGNIGTIIDVKNAAEFGYEEFQLEGENVNKILPPVIYSSFISQLRSIHDLWNPEARFDKSEESYICNQEGYLITVMVRNSLINMNNGELAVILAIKHRSCEQDIAILDEEGRYILCYVISI
jgi:hypothetical protein